MKYLRDIKLREWQNVLLLWFCVPFVNNLIDFEIFTDVTFTPTWFANIILLLLLQIFSSMPFYKDIFNTNNKYKYTYLLYNTIDIGYCIVRKKKKKIFCLFVNY